MSNVTSRVEIRALQDVEIELPQEVERLLDLAYNLWWAWNPPARHLFATIEPASWARYRNPVQLLLNVHRSQWETLIKNDTFIDSYHAVLGEFDRYMAADRSTWFRERYPEGLPAPVAYFSMEYGLHQSLAIYSGGLGVLSGDHCKAASDLGLPFVAVGLLYRLGYFSQAVDADGFQQHIYPEYDFTRLPVRPVLDERGRELAVQIPLLDRELSVKAWLAQIGRVPLLLLNTDIPANEPSDRPITRALYTRGRELRLVQEAVLGIGGARVLSALGLRPAVWHINEGHAVLLQVERMRQIVAAGKPFDEALAAVRENAVFTTHTPVPAGNERFDRALASEYLEGWARDLGIDTGRLLALGEADHGEPNQSLNLTAFALRTSTHANGVSRLNAEIADAMWRHLFPERPQEDPVVDGITNGVHCATWLGLELRALFARHLGSEWLERLVDPAGWEMLSEVTDEELWTAHQAQKRRMLRFARARLLAQYARHGRSPRKLARIEEWFDQDTLTIGFARRFATYKRAGLLFSDLHRLRGLVTNSERPVQIFLAGKAHPADRPGQELIQHIYRVSQEPGLEGRVVFLENYDMRVARMLTQGVDLWLNTPRRPQEACGTSGQKAAINGVLNCSVLDGWWPEAFDGENGWAIGGTDAPTDREEEDRQDALALYHTLEDDIVPLFYSARENGVPAPWLARMRHSILTVGPRFSASRMVRDYIEHAYMPFGRPSAG